MAIHFFEEAVQSKLKSKRMLKAFLKQQVKNNLEVDRVNLNYVFCTDKALLERNIQFLNHDTLTDIITFDLSENETELSSDIFISVDRVRENAEKFQTTYLNELHRVIFHGVLHLIGYGDHTKKERELMRKMEDQWIAAYKIFNPSLKEL